MTRAEVLAEAVRGSWAQQVGRLRVEVRTLGAWVEDRYESDTTWQVGVDTRRVLMETRPAEAIALVEEFAEAVGVLRELEALGIVDGAEVGA